MACVWIPSFCLDAARRRTPALAGRPLALHRAGSRAREVVAASTDLLARGLRPGTPLRATELAYPDAAFLPFDPAAADAAFTPVLDRLEAFSPVVAAAAPGLALLDVTGCELLYGSDAALADRLRAAVREDAGDRDPGVGIGLAGGVATAEIAARLAVDGRDRLVPPGGDAAFLAPLPVDVLPLTEDACERLELLGVRTVGDFARRLPAGAVARRFGEEGLRARRIARGQDDAPLRGRPQRLVLLDRVELEWAEENLDRLTFLLKALADRLARRLAGHGLAAQRLRVAWRLDARAGEPGAVERLLHLPEPTASGSGLLDLLRWHVEGLRLPAPVVAVEVAADDLAPPAGRQLRLRGGGLGPSTPFDRTRNARRAVARLRARWGADAARRPSLQSARRPEDAFGWLPADAEADEDGTPGAPACRRARKQDAPPGHGPALELPQPPLWLYDPPLPVRLRIGPRRGQAPTLTLGGRPARLARWAGPFRLVDRPWDAAGAERDYYQAATDRGAYWLFRDRRTGRWLCHAAYD
ncbi:MAG TPA: DNA polymerase Y family protein [Chloroflexota bacterium]|nr:DNA polymerase Y family protein [Chloroflexota bacterium]